MRGYSSRQSSAQAITAYFNKAHMRSQQETLGLIVGEILNEGRNLSRLAICTKLLRRVEQGNDSNLLIVFYVQIMPDDLVMQLHRF